MVSHLSSQESRKNEWFCLVCVDCGLLFWRSTNPNPKPSSNNTNPNLRNSWPSEQWASTVCVSALSSYRALTRFVGRTEEHSACKKLLQSEGLVLRIAVLASKSWHNGINTHSIRRPVVDEERMRPGHWLGTVLCVSFSALTMIVGWQATSGP